MYAAIAATTNRSPAPTKIQILDKMQASGLALKAVLFLTSQIRPLYPIEGGKRQHAVGTHAALPLQGISWPGFKKGWKKCVMTGLKKPPIHG